MKLLIIEDECSLLTGILHLLGAISSIACASSYSILPKDFNTISCSFEKKFGQLIGCAYICNRTVAEIAIQKLKPAAT